MSSYALHHVTRVELRDIRILQDGTPCRHIYVFDRDGNRHDITLFGDSTDADALRFDLEKETTE